MIQKPQETTETSEPMLIRGRSPTIVGGSTSKQHRPICHVPAGSRIFKLLNRHNTSSQRRFNAGPTSTTLDRRQTNAAPTHSVRWIGFHPNELDANTIKPPSTQCRWPSDPASSISTPRQTRHTEPMLVQWWASVADVDPKLPQHRPNVSRLPEQQRLDASRWPVSQCWPDDGGEPTAGQHRV